MEKEYINHIHFYLSRLISRNWRYLVVGKATIILLITTIPNYIPPGVPHLGGDNSLFLYGGWLWAETNKTPYIHLWDVKPPAIFETAGILSLLSGGNIQVMLLLSVITMSLLIIFSNILIGEIICYHTSNPIAAYIGATTPLVFYFYYRFAATGLRAKHFTIFFGLLGVYLYLIKNRWMLGGFSAALAAGYWQFGIIFPAIAVIEAYTVGKNEIKKLIGGGIIATLLVVVPVYASSPDALLSMIVQVVGTPLLASEPIQPFVRFERFYLYFDAALPVIGLGLLGTLIGISERETTWIAVGSGWFLVQISLLDFDGTGDLLLLLVFAALGMGLLVEAADEQIFPLYLVLGATLTAFFVCLVNLPTPPSSFYSPESTQALFLQQEVLEQCHLRRSATEERFLQFINERADIEGCRYSTQLLFDILSS